MREINLLHKIRHPNIIAVMAVCPTVNKCHIVMEYFKSYSLHDILFSRDVEFQLDMKSKNSITDQLFCAIAYLHLQDQSTIHRDIKLANILVNKHLTAKLCDLGLGKSDFLSDSLQSTNFGGWVGTMLYLAPEILLESKCSNKTTEIWSLACTLSELFSKERV